MSIRERIIQLFQSDPELSIKEIVDKLLISKQMAHIVLNQLLAEGAVEKLGRTPKTIYRWRSAVAQSIKSTERVATEDAQVLKKHFLLISETGQLHEGLEGFEVWCRQRKLPLMKTIGEYVKTLEKYNTYYNDRGFIDGIEKLRSTKGYPAIHLDGLFYLDFYAIERFGKTRLGTLLHYAKQGQSKTLMKMLVDEIGDRPQELINQLGVDVAVFVPPTIRREVQLMRFLKTHIKLKVPLLEIKKISGLIPVPQKSLSKLEERIANAQNTFSVPGGKNYQHILLIDDAVGSGATVNEIAGKLKQKGITKKVSALAITGSFKGFDVITDV
jgi:phosphoribosylpyrophosphate synthetase